MNTSEKSENVVPINEENALTEMQFLTSIPGMSEKLEKGINTPVEECDDFEW